MVSLIRPALAAGCLVLSVASASAQGGFAGTWSGQATQTNNFPAFALTLTISDVTANSATVVRETSQSNGPSTFKAEVRGSTLSFGDRVQHTMSIEGNAAKVYMRNISDGTTAEATLVRKPN